MSRRVIDWKAGVATTVGAASAILCETDDLPDGAGATFEIHLQGRELATGDVATAVFQHRARRVAGVLSLVGNLTALLGFAAGSDAALAACAAALLVVGQRVRLQATGVVLTNVEWFGDMRIRIN